MKMGGCVYVCVERGGVIRCLFVCLSVCEPFSSLGF
jgi:hypothetical protein